MKLKIKFEEYQLLEMNLSDRIPKKLININTVANNV
jgi:hypothetical protein